MEDGSKQLPRTRVTSSLLVEPSMKSVVQNTATVSTADGHGNPYQPVPARTNPYQPSRAHDTPRHTAQP